MPRARRPPRLRTTCVAPLQTVRNAMHAVHQRGRAVLPRSSRLHTTSTLFDAGACESSGRCCPRVHGRSASPRAVDTGAGRRGQLRPGPDAAPGQRRNVLFGSRARGDARPDSDLDLLIIEDSDLPPLQTFCPLLTGARRPFPSQRRGGVDTEEVQESTACPCLYHDGSEGRQNRSMRDKPDHARGWFRKADSDLQTAKTDARKCGPTHCLFSCPAGGREVSQGRVRVHGTTHPSHPQPGGVAATRLTLMPALPLTDVDLAELTPYLSVTL